jgi:hypothetical protein
VSAQTVPPGRLWLLALGYGIWCSALVLLYALHALGCAFAWPPGALRTVLALVFVAHLIAIGVLWRAYARRNADAAYGATGSFFHEVAVWTLATAFVATVITLGPTLFLATCV